VFASATLDTILSPTLSVYREIAHTPAWYVNFGISHSQPIVDKITLDLAASAGYYYSDDSDFSEAKDPNSKYRAFHNGLVSAGFTIPFGEYFSIKPLIAYSFPLSSKADDYITASSISDHSNFIYGGVTLSFAF
jgi:Zn-dependent M28 family amino/carboxypeptidase